jgi:hypothetical protein
MFLPHLLRIVRGTLALEGIGVLSSSNFTLKPHQPKLKIPEVQTKKDHNFVHPGEKDASQHLSRNISNLPQQVHAAHAHLQHSIQVLAGPDQSPEHDANLDYKCKNMNTT